MALIDLDGQPIGLHGVKAWGSGGGSDPIHGTQGGQRLKGEGARPASALRWPTQRSLDVAYPCIPPHIQF